MARRVFERVELGAHIVGPQIGGNEAHAAADVIADRLGDREASRDRDGADRDTGALVEVGRAHNLLDRRVGSEQFGMVLAERNDRVRDLGERVELDDGSALDGHRRRGDDGNGDVRIREFGNDVRSSLQAGAGHGGSFADGPEMWMRRTALAKSQGPEGSSAVSSRDARLEVWHTKSAIPLSFSQSSSTFD